MLKHFCQLLGSCGPLYAVEQLRPLELPGLLSRDTAAGWPRRAELALAILQFLARLHPLHLCDVKPEHLGLGDGGRVKWLDLDAVLAEPLLQRGLERTLHCTSHQGIR